MKEKYVQIVHAIMAYFPEYTKNIHFSTTTTKIQPNLKIGKKFE